MKLTTENKKSEEVQSEDYSYAEVIRVALRLFEQRYISVIVSYINIVASKLRVFFCCASSQVVLFTLLFRIFFPLCSNDTRWVHVMRTLYRGVPAITYDSVQSLLEQIFTESVQVAKLLLSVLEDTAVLQGQNVTYQSVVLRQRVRNNMIDNIPIMDESDVRLALVVARSVCNAGANRHAQASGNMNNIDQIPLPVSLSLDSSPVSVEAVYESQLCSRCVCMLVLACVASNIRHFLLEKASRDNGNKQSASENDTRVYATLYDVLDKVINNTLSGADRSSSGFHVAVRVAELVRALLVLGTHPHITQDCFDVVNGWFESAYLSNTAEDKNDGVVKLERNSKPILPVPRIQLPPVHDLLLRGLCHVYKTVHKNIRPALLSSILKGIVLGASFTTNGNNWTIVDSNPSDSNTGEMSSTVPAHARRAQSSRHKGEENVQLSVAVSVQPLHELLQYTLYTLCTTATEYVTEAHSIIQSHYTTLLTSRLTSCIALVQNSLIHCCSTSPVIFGMLQSSLQKSIQSTDPQRQFDSLRSLVRLLFAAPEEKQEHVVKTIQHAFSRNAVYSREIVLLLMHYLNTMQTVNEAEEGELDMDTQEDSNGANVDTGEGSRPLARHTLKRLQEMVKLKLDVFFVYDQNDDSVVIFDVTRCISGARSVNTSNSVGVTTVPNAVSILEDVGYLLQLHYQLDLLLYPEDTVHDLQAVISGDVDGYRQGIFNAPTYRIS